MNCRECGAEVNVDGVYCHKCGARLNPPDQVEPSTAWSDEQSAPAGESDAPATPRERLAQAVSGRRNTADEPEQELWQGTYSSKAMIAMWILCSVFSVAMLAVGIWINKAWLWLYVVVPVILLAWLYAVGLYAYRRLSVSYRLTNRRFFHERGILRHVTDRIEVIDMDDIAFEQTIIDRMVGVGTIRITSSDRSHPILLVPGIEKVKEVASMMDEARLAERMRRGLHIESI